MSVEGMYFDELSKIRVLQPEVLTQTEELREECKQFVDSKLIHRYSWSMHKELRAFMKAYLLKYWNSI